jgi:hypothetical protein
MASPHASVATGRSVPALPVLDSLDSHLRALTTHNPFLNVDAVPPLLRPVNQNAPLAHSLDVTVLWGSTVLTVQRLSPPRPFAVGEPARSRGRGRSSGGDVDFVMAEERLGASRKELVVLRAGVPFAIWEPGAAPLVLEKGERVDASGAIVDCADVAPGARGIELRQDRVVIIEASGLSFRLAGGERLERVPRALLGGTERSAFVTLGTAALLQGALVATLAFLTPSLGWAADDELQRDRLQLMQQYLHASAAREEEQRPAEPQQGGGEKGAPAERSRGPEGAAGRPENTHARRMAIQGDTKERAVSRDELRREAETFGTIALLATLNAGTGPSSPWGADLAMGPDAVSAAGDLFSQDIGEGRGMGGLGVSGLGNGAGGKGIGVGMGNIGTCLGLNCYGSGEGGFGRSVGRSAPEPGRFQFKIRPNGITKVSGRLPPEVIQRVVRQNFGRFRACYEVGLRSNPNLEGRVTARFVIGSDGSVSNVSAGGDLPSSEVKSCVASAFYGLSFPAPEGGIVTVSYPIMLTPS